MEIVVDTDTKFDSFAWFQKMYNTEYDEHHFITITRARRECWKKCKEFRDFPENYHNWVYGIKCDKVLETMMLSKMMKIPNMKEWLKEEFPEDYLRVV